MRKLRNIILLGFGVIFVVSCSPDDATPEHNQEVLKIATETPLPVSDLSYETTEIFSIFPEPVEDYLPNPGIGWQHEPREGDTDFLPETVSYSDRPLIGWKILNPAEGVYDWSALEEQFSRAVANGNQFSFRVYTMRGEPYGGHYIPEWVLRKGATLLASGEPDYSNCTYQEEWGKFVVELIKRYDGNPDIAFIDISGYGNFSEWSWQDNQTRWDELWEQSYSNGQATPATMTVLDSQARRRLADMFIGGLFDLHECRDADGTVKTVLYSYDGFQKTQLVMPYAGIAQSTEYVFTRRSDVGFRFDCLGTNTEGIVERLEHEISELWKTAPIVFEFCVPDRFDIELADDTLHAFHGSIVHNNGYSGNPDAIELLMRRIGYKYFLKGAHLQILDGNKLELVMDWQNNGIAPSYPKMGQTFKLHVYLLDNQSGRTIDYPVSTNISAWMPAFEEHLSTPVNEITTVLDLPADLPPGNYQIKISIIEDRTGEPIYLAFSQPDALGRYPVTSVPIVPK